MEAPAPIQEQNASVEPQTIGTQEENGKIDKKNNKIDQTQNIVLRYFVIQDQPKVTKYNKLFCAFTSVSIFLLFISLFFSMTEWEHTWKSNFFGNTNERSVDYSYQISDYGFVLFLYFVVFAGFVSASLARGYLMKKRLENEQEYENLPNTHKKSAEFLAGGALALWLLSIIIFWMKFNSDICSDYDDLENEWNEYSCGMDIGSFLVIGILVGLFAWYVTLLRAKKTLDVLDRQNVVVFV